MNTRKIKQIIPKKSISSSTCIFSAIFIRIVIESLSLNKFTFLENFYLERAFCFQVVHAGKMKKEKENEGSDVERERAAHEKDSRANIHRQKGKKSGVDTGRF